MIDDDDVGFLSAISHAGNEAGIEVGALLAETRFGTGVDVAPERERFGEVCEFGAIAGVAFSRPVGDFLEIIDLVETLEHGRRLRTRETIEAEVVAAAFHVSRSKAFRQDALEERD